MPEVMSAVHAGAAAADIVIEGSPTAARAPADRPVAGEPPQRSRRAAPI
jgi:hypothetical protein